jgi:O-antigen/teichoic acid export membrane protein
VSAAIGFRVAYLRGKSDFIATTISGIAGSSTKIVASLALVVLGFETAGAVGGILISQLIVFWYAASKAKKLGFIQYHSGLQPDWALLKPQAKYAGLVLFVSLTNVLMYTIDVTIVKYLFSPDVAGQYAAIATISRIVFFLTASIGMVLLSSVKISKPPRENSRLLIRSIGMVLALGGISALIFMLFPTQIAHLLFGHRYDAYSGLLPLLSVSVLAMSLNALIANYHIALRHYWVIAYTGIGAITTTILLVTSHATPADIVRGLAIGSGVMLIGLVLWTGYRAGYRLQ